MLNLQSVTYKRSDGYPVLHLMINGKTVIVHEPKMPLLRKGFVFLAYDDVEYWNTVLKPISVETEPGHIKTFKGFTSQKNIVRAVKDWVNYLNDSEDFV
jgi:hypothetical protein